MNIFKIFKQLKGELFKALEVGDVQTAILEVKTHIIYSCNQYDPFGFCTVSDCFQCKNCAYRIQFNNGIIVQTDDFASYPHISEEKYLLEFITPVGKDIYGYLTDSQSDYRITRMSDNIRLRLTKEDQLKGFGMPIEKSHEKVNQTNRKRLLLIKK